MSWTVVRNVQTREWTFHDMSKHPYIDKSGSGEIVHGFQTMDEARAWAEEREKTLRAREEPTCENG